MWNFRKVDAWNRALELSKIVYDLTRRFPDEEKYGLSSQLRRAVISISSNIAEGCGRRTSKDFIGFLYNALGSTKEVENQLLAAVELRYLSGGESKLLMDDLTRIGRMLLGLIGHVSEKGIK